MGRRYFELSDAASHKFWEIRVHGSSHTVRYGRIGADGTVKTKEFADPKAAVADARKLSEKKIKKGYTEVAGAKAKPAKAKAVKPANASKSALYSIDCIEKFEDELDMDEYKSMSKNTKIEQMPFFQNRLATSLREFLEATRAMPRAEFYSR